MTGALIILLFFGGLALISWPLAELFGWWVWPLAGGATCLFVATILPGRLAWAAWMSGGLLRHFKAFRDRSGLPPAE